MQTRIEVGLAVTLTQQPEDEPVCEECLSGFRKVGGNLRIETGADGD